MCIVESGGEESSILPTNSGSDGTMSFYRTCKLLSRGFIQNGTCQLEMWFYQRKTKVCATSGHLLESLKYTPAKMGTSEKSRLWKLMESLTSGGDVSGPLCSWKDQFTVGAATICQKNVEEIYIYIKFILAFATERCLISSSTCC